ncbi:MAG: hypothetical protein K0S57_2718 [Ramlibacter sp.]|jgi:hypothetical protein|nr:hypothetical protein [Ramlibacter sp.]
MSSKAGRYLRAALLGLGALACAGAGAHEFWMWPQSFHLPVGGAAVLSLSVGENFEGEPIAFSRPLVANLRRLAAADEADLQHLTPDSGSADSIRVDLPRPGTHVIALDTHPSLVVLEADKFNDYLREDGLVGALRAREAAGKSATPGRERFRRNIKTILHAGGRSDGAFRRRTGQRLEIVPLHDPARLGPAQPMGFQVWFDDRPLAGALVRLWHGRGPGVPKLTLTQVSNAHGKVTLALPREGTWMASVVHMVPADAGCDCDWDSYWGNLTFAVPRAAGGQPGRQARGAPRM